MTREVVTSQNRKEYMEKKLGKEEDKPKFKFPHYQIGDIVKTPSGHIKIHEYSQNPLKYTGVWTSPYGEDETKYGPKKKITAGVLHEDVGTDKHHLYARVGEYPEK
jgi:hypothetical protein